MEPPYGFNIATYSFEIQHKYVPQRSIHRHSNSHYIFLLTKFSNLKLREEFMNIVKLQKTYTLF